MLDLQGPAVQGRGHLGMGTGKGAGLFGKMQVLRGLGRKGSVMAYTVDKPCIAMLRWDGVTHLLMWAQMKRDRLGLTSSESSEPDAYLSFVLCYFLLPIAVLIFR